MQPYFHFISTLEAEKMNRFYITVSRDSPALVVVVVVRSKPSGPLGLHLLQHGVVVDALVLLRPGGHGRVGQLLLWRVARRLLAVAVGGAGHLLAVVDRDAGARAEDGTACSGSRRL